MSLTLKISVPNISSLIGTYDTIRVYKSVVSKDGPFTEITASASQSASILGAEMEPFTDLNGKTLILRVKDAQGTHPDVVVSFTDANPVSTLQVVTAINATSIAAVASDSGGQVQITTNAEGQATSIMVMGGSALADLGFVLYQTATGSDPYLELVAGQTTYTILDPDGQNSYWYRWQFYNTGSSASSALTNAIHPQDAIIDPNRKVQDFRATKGLTLVRGREHTFRMAFWQDQAANIPLNPDSSGQYPTYSIFDINGELIATGRADVDGSAPNYKAVFLVPQDALVSGDDRRWRIEWFMLTDTGRQVQQIDEFDVRDEDVTETESRDQRYLAWANQPFRLRLRLPTAATAVTFTLTESDNPDVIPIPLTSVVTQITEGDTVVYYYDVPPNTLQSSTMGKSYTGFWAVQQTPTSDTSFIFQIIDVPPTKILRFFVSLRQQIDKSIKRKGTIQSYEDSDIFEYLRQGLNYINGVHPANLNFDLVTIPPMMEPYWLMAALLWGLQAQQLCEIDVAFAFSGQQVTLDYDRSSALETAIARAIQLIDAGAKAIKTHLYRNNVAIGSYAGRAPRLTGNNNFVYPISSGGSQNFLTLLQSVGLL